MEEKWERLGLADVALCARYSFRTAVGGGYLIFCWSTETVAPLSRHRYLMGQPPWSEMMESIACISSLVAARAAMVF